jgi:EAL domain-containing protein (putative c-di-GMP-specific phosphodiesterase class I)
MAFKTLLSQLIRPEWDSAEIGPVQFWRERRMLTLFSAAMLVIGVAWGLFFAGQGRWQLVTLDLLMVINGAAAAVLTQRKKLQLAAIILFSTLISVICTIALVFDVPSPQAWRSVHLYLLPLSVAALMAFRTSSAWWRHGLAVVCLVAFGILSVTHYAPYPDLALPDSVRIYGTWVQMVIAVALLYTMLHLMQNDVVSRSSLENDLRQAIAQKQFALHYQVQVDANNQLIGAEALIRWHHPERGMVMPGQFIEAAEQSGLILPMGQWVLETACAQLQRWSTQAHTQGLRLAVNISPLQFGQDNFVPQILDMIDRHGIDAGLLELELTETMLAANLQDIIAKMSALKARGVAFSLDDFGTGYSSLNYLKRLPLNQLKIDQSFIRDVLTDPNDASIARTVVALGHNLGLAVIAEGVETQEQRAFLVESGCEFFQGYLFSKPLSADDFNVFVAQHIASHATAQSHPPQPGA